MALQTSPFPNGFVAGIHAVGWAFILPCFWFLDRVIAVCKSTTLEQTQRVEQECYLHPLKVFFGSIIFFILFVVTAPLAFLGLLLWAPVQACRRPFYYHRVTLSSPEETNKGFELAGKASFGFAAANVCLLPDSLARFNNLGHTQRRASAIGQRIVQGLCRPHIRIFVDSPSSIGTLSTSNSMLNTVNSSTYGATDRQAQGPLSHSSDSGEGPISVPVANSQVVGVPCDDDDGEEVKTESPSAVTTSYQNSSQHGQAGRQSAPQTLPFRVRRQQDDVHWEVSALFPANVDILCLEEVFDKRAAKKLTEALRPVFGHILYDIGVYACHPPCRCSSFKFLNSGLFVASRFPVLEAQYHCFPNSRGEDALAAKGLLSAKVNVTTCLILYFQLMSLSTIHTNMAGY